VVLLSCVIGLLLIQAALLSDPDEAPEWLVLQKLAEEPRPFLLSFGLVAYAIHMLILARYYRLLPNEPAAGCLRDHSTLD